MGYGGQMTTTGRAGPPPSGGYDLQAASSVTVPPAVYAGSGAMGGGGPSNRYSLTQPMQGVGSYDAFDRYDSRDGINTMLHQPLIPQQQQQQRPGGSNANAGINPSNAYYGSP